MQISMKNFMTKNVFNKNPVENTGLFVCFALFCVVVVVAVVVGILFVCLWVLFCFFFVKW